MCRCPSCFRHDDYGDTYVLYFLTRVWILTRSPNVLKTLLVSGDQSVFVKTLKLHTHNIFGARYVIIISFISF